MAWSGGTFTRVGGVTHWVDDKNAAIPILASRHDTNDEDIATGINACLTRDNQAKPTANFLPNTDNSFDLGALATRWRSLFTVDATFSTSAASNTFAKFFANGQASGARGWALRVGGAADFIIATTDDSGNTVGTALDILRSGTTVTQLSIGINGSAGTPALAINDADTGLFLAGANDLRFSAGGTQVLQIATTSIRPIAVPIWPDNGSAGAPVYSNVNDTDTGFFFDTANQIAIGLGGVAAGQIAQGSFTGTLTGFTANPSGTVNWQRFGNLVIVSIPTAITATSNATTMTMTGVPAAIQPSVQRFVPCISVRNSASVPTYVNIPTGSGTWTFSLLDDSANPVSVNTGLYLAAGVKGLGTETVIVYSL